MNILKNENKEYHEHMLKMEGVPKSKGLAEYFRPHIKRPAHTILKVTQGGLPDDAFLCSLPVLPGIRIYNLLFGYIVFSIHSL